MIREDERILNTHHPLSQTILKVVIDGAVDPLNILVDYKRVGLVVQ